MMSTSPARMFTALCAAGLITLAMAAPEAREAPSAAPEPAMAAAAQAADHGKEVYTANKCQMCHMIDGVGSKRVPLDGVGSKLTKEEIRKWIVAPAEMNPKVKKPNFAKIAEKDLAALVDYLATLKK
jgi:mono/diheme cytochrome c family protein